MEEKVFWYWCACFLNVSLKVKLYLLDKFRSPEIIFRMSEDKLCLDNVAQKYAAKISEAKNYIDTAEKEYHKLGQRGIDFITIADREYPEKLKYIYEPPICLFVKGELPCEKTKTVAIVGARDCSHYGAETAKWFGGELAKAGMQIISGVASGIDSKGLNGALGQNGKVFGVLGCGVDVVYPPENIMLYEDIINNGGIISEYPCGTKPLAYHFPQRNRIISALADCVLVVEARKKSGSLITADLALEQGKDVAAVPGRHSDDLSEGTNSLIKNGAYLVISPQDILDIMGVETRINNKNVICNQNALDKTKEKVYSCLHLEPKYIETIIDEAGLSYGEVLEILVELEMDGIIKQTSKNYYAVCIG